ncbi:hypothetical protein ACC699_39555, partial [Rhizobium ruizarguesonis]
QLTYLLTLPPYGFFWFQLTADADPPAWLTAPPEQLPDLLTMVIRRNLLDLATGSAFCGRQVPCA